jgi:ATP-dependent Lon protease
MIDAAFFDRFHAYIPGWEIPKMRPEFFTNQYGFIVDYLAEFFREMRKQTFGDAINKFFRLGRDLNQRDTIAVKHTVSGLLKLLYPHEAYDKEGVRQCLEYALEARRRVKEQLKRIGGMEFFDVHLSYIDLETNEEKIVRVKEQGGDSLIPDDPLNPGSLFTVARGSGGHLGLYRLETQVTAGNGQLKVSGFGSNTAAKESVKVGFDYFRGNATQIQASVKAADHDYHLHVVEAHNTGPSTTLTMAAYVALCSALVGKAIESQMVVLGSMSLGGNIVPVENLAESLQVAAEAGAKRLLLPMASVGDIPTIPGELFAKFQTSFYADPRDAVFKALGVH